ncbi:hypothetical protein [Aestuariivirga litoralis]|uniref:hypothetical protein n=1 Tax=Aestuariivirga litoralis TaxID=2650924 RepID=UPI0018C83B9D|nr:hypothetical protein [Aestuariivirga litoralis]MBG1232481.1 hypothetical protein [Aestuariivirga litoralis]
MRDLAVTPAADVLRDIRDGSPVLWRCMQVMAAGLVICLGLMLVDQRQIIGVSVWDKPAKFFLSLIVQFATVSFALSLMPEKVRPRRAAIAMSIAAFGELAYITLRAAQGEASHFNTSSLFANIAYALMGLGAVTISLTALFIGFKLWSLRRESLMHESAALGLTLGMLIGTAAGIYLSQQQGHWVGGEMSDAHGLGFFGWSTSGGDLRVAHFIGLHTAQVLPLAALTGDRRWVYLAALACIGLCAFTFAQAVMGIPLLRG